MCEICNNTIQSNNQYDPTRTLTLRTMFVRNMDKRFNGLVAAVIQKVVKEDFFGLKDIQTNAVPYAFPRSADKVAEFMLWLKGQVDKGILSVNEYEQLGAAIENAWTNMYVTDSYKRGIVRARYELQKAGYDVPSIETTGGIFVSMNVPLHMDRVGLLYTRVFTDLKGITDEMSVQISKVLSQGMADGEGMLSIAKKLIGTINGTGMGDLGLTDTLGRFIPAQRRAQILARTEIIRAHHQAMIQEYRNWGSIDLYVMAEMLTAGDNRVCSKCEELAAQSPYTLDAVQNLIPVHPDCRCIALPFEVGVDELIMPFNKR